MSSQSLNSGIRSVIFNFSFMCLSATILFVGGEFPFDSVTNSARCGVSSRPEWLSSIRVWMSIENVWSALCDSWSIWLIWASISFLLSCSSLQPPWALSINDLSALRSFSGSLLLEFGYVSRSIWTCLTTAVIWLSCMPLKLSSLLCTSLIRCNSITIKFSIKF